MVQATPQRVPLGVEGKGGPAVAEERLVADVKRALSVARLALEQDAAEARTRGWGTPAPDPASVATLASGILIAERVRSELQAQKEMAPARRAPRRRARAVPAA